MKRLKSLHSWRHMCKIKSTLCQGCLQDGIDYLVEGEMKIRASGKPSFLSPQTILTRKSLHVKGGKDNG